MSALQLPPAPGSPEAITAARAEFTLRLLRIAPELTADHLAAIEDACAMLAEEIARPAYTGSRRAARTA